MSTLNTANIRQRLWRGYDDPGLPVGTWVGWVNVQHDASGGDASAILNLEPSSEPDLRLTGRFYNVEALEIFGTQGTNDTGELLIVNFSVLIDNAATNRAWTFNVFGNQGGNQALELLQQLSRPLFLGQARTPGIDASIRATIDNVDTEDHTLWAEGYIWEGRSTQSEGGLRRPVDSLYG